MGCAEGRSPFVGSLRVSPRYDFSLFLARRGAREMVGRVFKTLLGEDDDRAVSAGVFTAETVSHARARED